MTPLEARVDLEPPGTRGITPRQTGEHSKRTKCSPGAPGGVQAAEATPVVNAHCCRGSCKEWEQEKVGASSAVLRRCEASLLLASPALFRRAHLHPLAELCLKHKHTTPAALGNRSAFK